MSMACQLLPGDCQLLREQRYCFVVQAINAHGIAGPRRRSDGVQVCGPPTAGVVVEASSPVPQASALWGVHALTHHARVSLDDQAPVNQDLDYTYSNTLHVRWYGFSDDCALGIEAYTVSLLRFDVSAHGFAAANQDAWEQLNSTQILRGSPRVHSFELDVGGMYRVRVCGISLTKLEACAESDGVVYDTTPPTHGELCVRAASQWWCSNAKTASAADDVTAYVSELLLARASVSWPGFSDYESRIAGFSIAVGSAPGASDAHAWTNVGWSTSQALAPVLPVGALIYVSAICVNSVGLQSNLSIAVVVDSTAPVLPLQAFQLLPLLLSQTMQRNILYTNTTTPQLAVDLSQLIDPESPLVAVQVEIFDARASLRAVAAGNPRTTEGEVHLLDIGAGGVQVLSLGSLAHNARVSVLVIATNAAQLQSELHFSVQVDTAPPLNGNAMPCDAMGQPITGWPQNDTLYICFAGFSGSKSGLSHQRISLVGIISGGAPVEYSVPHSEHVQLTGLRLPCKDTLRITTVALSFAGVAATALTSELRMDCSPPENAVTHAGFTSALGQLPTVQTGRAQCSEPTDAVYGWWDGYADPQGNLTRYDMAVVLAEAWHSQGQLAVPKWTDVGLSRLVLLSTTGHATAPSAHLLVVRACNSMGLCSMGVASGQLLVITSMAPVGGEVLLGTSWPGGRVLNSAASAIASWLNFADPTMQVADLMPAGFAYAEGTALTYEACVGSSPYGCQAMPFTPTSSNTSWHADGLSLTCGSTYYVAVRATNCAGLQRTVASTGAKLCCEPPKAGVVTLLDSLGRPVLYVGESTANHTNVTWSGFSDGCSAVREYALSIEQVLDGAALWNSSVYEGSVLHAMLPGVVLSSLPEGAALAVVVTATSHAGLSTRAVGGFRVDRTPPVARGPVFNGDMQTTPCQSATTPFRASWEQVEDLESGVESIEWALGYWPHGEDLLAFTRVEGDDGNVVREWTPKPSRSNRGHVKYNAVVYSTLRVRNGAGDAALFSSPPMRIVATNCSASFMCLAPAALMVPMLPSMLPLVDTWM